MIECKVLHLRKRIYTIFIFNETYHKLKLTTIACSNRDLIVVYVSTNFQRYTSERAAAAS